MPSFQELLASLGNVHAREVEKLAGEVLEARAQVASLRDQLEVSLVTCKGGDGCGRRPDRTEGEDWEAAPVPQEHKEDDIHADDSLPLPSELCRRTAPCAPSGMVGLAALQSGGPAHDMRRDDTMQSEVPVEGRGLQQMPETRSPAALSDWLAQDPDPSRRLVDIDGCTVASPRAAQWAEQPGDALGESLEGAGATSRLNEILARQRQAMSLARSAPACDNDEDSRRVDSVKTMATCFSSAGTGRPSVEFSDEHPSIRFEEVGLELRHDEHGAGGRRPSKLTASDAAGSAVPGAPGAHGGAASGAAPAVASTTS